MAILNLAAGCVSPSSLSPTDFETAPLQGRIYSSENRPVAGAVVVVNGVAGPVSDVNGKFIIPELARGEHVLLIQKSGFEAQEVNLQFFSRTQMVYVNLTSLATLRALAEKHMDALEWNAALMQLERATAIAPADPATLFLSAIVHYRLNRHSDAAELLEKLVEAGHREPSLLLFAADLYEIYLKNRERAVFMLKELQKVRNEPSIADRLKRLEA